MAHHSDNENDDAWPTHAVRWRRLDHPADEHLRLESTDRGGSWTLRGVVTGTLPDARVYSLQYEITCNADWVTRTANVSGRVGGTAVAIALEREAASGRWTHNGQDVPAVEGCLDVDLGFSPSTNTLPIRRLRLPVGGEAVVSAAWLRFPQLQLERLEQVYRRVAETKYVYESAGGRFRADLEVDDAGLVQRYGEYWHAV